MKWFSKNRLRGSLLFNRRQVLICEFDVLIVVHVRVSKLIAFAIVKSLTGLDQEKAVLCGAIIVLLELLRYAHTIDPIFLSVSNSILFLHFTELV
jgi:hypothetical protein